MIHRSMRGENLIIMIVVIIQTTDRGMKEIVTMRGETGTETTQESIDGKITLTLEEIVNQLTMIVVTEIVAKE